MFAAPDNALFVPSEVLECSLLFSVDSIPFSFRFPLFFSLFFKINYLWLCIVHSFKYGLHPSCVLAKDVESVIDELSTEWVARQTSVKTQSPTCRPYLLFILGFCGSDMNPSEKYNCLSHRRISRCCQKNYGEVEKTQFSAARTHGRRDGLGYGVTKSLEWLRLTSALYDVRSLSCYHLSSYECFYMDGSDFCHFLMCRLQCHDWILALFLYREYKSYCQRFLRHRYFLPAYHSPVSLKVSFDIFVFILLFPYAFFVCSLSPWQVSRKYFHISSCILYCHFSCLFLLFF